MHNTYYQPEGLSTVQLDRQAQPSPIAGIVPTRMAPTTLAQRLKHALAVSNPKMSGQGLEVAASLPKGYVSRVLAGSRKKLGPDMLQRMSRALGVDYGWLATGSSPGELAAVGASPLPPATERMVEDDGLAWLIDQAWDKDEHAPADIRIVQAFAKQRGPLLRRDPDMVALVHTWLDTAAGLRRKGKAGTFSEMIDALTTRVGRAEFVDGFGRSEEDIKGDEEYRRQTGREPPGWSGYDEGEETVTPPKTLGRGETPRAGAVVLRGTTPKPSSALPRSRK